MDFMTEMDQQGLILWESTDAGEAPATVVAMPRMQPARAAVTAAGSAAGGGLLRSIRRRLGLV